MIHLISSNGRVTAPSITVQNETAEAVSKCLRFIRKVLHLDAKMSTLDSSSSSFQLLTEMAQSQKFIEFKGKIFIPALKKDKSTWGFVEINSILQKPTPVQIRKAVQAVQDMLLPFVNQKHLKALNSSELHYSVLVLQSDLDGGHRMSSKVFYNEKYTSFINLAEWIKQDPAFTLKSLREFTDSLLYIPEVLDLTEKERSIVALYSRLPNELRGSSLIVCTKLSFDQLSSTISSEKGFLSTFKSKKTLFDKQIEKRQQFYI